MARRLIMHCLPPDGPGEPLQRRYLDTRLDPRRRMVLSDPRHVVSARYPGEAPLPGPQVRLVTGPAPFGYLDEADDTAVYVVVLGDPAETFLRGAQRVHEAGEADARLLAGPGFAPHPGDDLDATALRLLEASWARRIRLNPLTRLCAGAPLAADENEDAMAGETLLRAARANLARTNLLIGCEGGLDGFAEYLSEVFGWAPPKHANELSGARAGRDGAAADRAAGAIGTDRPRLCETVRADTLVAVREAVQLDMALLQAAMRAELLEA